MKTTILLLIICLSTFVFSQNNFGYKHTNGKLNNCTVASNGDYLVTGTIYNHLKDYFVARISPSGDTLWTKSIWRTNINNQDYYEEAFFIKELANGEILISGNISTSYLHYDGLGAELHKLSANGEVIWSREIPSYVKNIFVNSNNEIIFTQNSYPMVGGPRKEFIKMDFDGNLLWSSCFYNYDYGFIDVVELADGNIFIVEKNHFILFDSTQVNVIKKIDFPSNINPANVYFNRLFLLPNNDFVLFGTFVFNGQATTNTNFFAARFDSSGTLIWSKYYQTPTNFRLNISSKISQTESGNILFITNIREYNQNQLTTDENCILEIDLNGDIQNVTPINSNFKPIDIEQTADSGYILTGTKNNVSYLLKMDSTLQSSCIPFQPDFTNPLIEFTQENLILSDMYYGGVFEEQLINSFFVEILDVYSESGSEIEKACYCDTVLAVPQINISGSTTLCTNDTITLSSDIQEGYLWSTGDTTQSISVGQVGTYQLQTTNGNCLLESGFISTTNYPFPIISNTGPLTFCIGDSVLLSSSFPIGNVWSTGDTTQSIYVKTTGSYTVSNIQGNCSSNSFPVQVTTKPYPPVPIITSPTPVLCQGGFLVLTSSENSNHWSTGVNGKHLTINQSGFYSASTVNYSGCTSYSDTIEIMLDSLTPPQIPTISSSINPPFCVGDSLILTASISNPIWTTGDTTQSILITHSASDIAISHQVGSCYYSSSTNLYLIHQPPTRPEITSVQNTNCPYSQVILKSGYHPMIWTTGENSNQIQVTESGFYSGYITNNYGCTSYSDTIEITIDPNASALTPVVSSNSTSPFCYGDTIQLTSSIADVVWSTGDTTQTIFISNTATNVFAIHQNGSCEYSSPPVNYFFDNYTDTPSITQIPNPYCTSINSTLSSGNQHVIWSTGEYTNQIQITENGFYSAYITSSFGCTYYSDTVYFEIDSSQYNYTTISSSQTSDIICQGDSVILSSSKPFGNFWLPTGDTTSSIVVNNPGNYYVLDLQCQISSNQINVAVQQAPNPPFIVGTNYSCHGDSIVLTSYYGSPYITLWSTGDSTNSITLYNSDTVYLAHIYGPCTVTSLPFAVTIFETIPSVYIQDSLCDGSIYHFGNQNLNLPGEYSHVFTSAFGCDSIVNLTLILKSSPALPTIEVHGDTLISSSSTGNQWYLGDYSSPILGANYPVYIATESGYYYLSVSDSSGCTTRISTAIVIDYSANIDENKLGNQIQVVPNPTSDKLMIITAVSIEKIRITNLLGEIINEFDFSSTIDVSQLSSGVYYLNLTSTNSRYIIKFIKK